MIQKGDRPVEAAEGGDRSGIEHMKVNSRQPRFYRGYSLGEMLASMVIGAMVLTAILGVYGRANRAADAVLEKIDAPAQAREVLQLIARDLDRVMETEDVEVQIKNGFDNGFPSAELVLRRTYKDSKAEKKVLEEITWRSGYDYDSAAPGLVLYRSYEGIGLEDALLDSKREDWESNYPFVPVCGGVTLFTIEAPKGEGILRVWPAGAPPTGITVTLSFAEPYERARGQLDVPEEEKVSRTMTINRMRPIKFSLASEEGQDDRSKADTEDQAMAEPEPNETTTQQGAAGPGRTSGRSSNERVSRPTTRR